MLEEIKNLPKGVIGVEASGEVSGDDYANVLVPLIESAQTDGGKLRFLYVLGDFGFSVSGAWADTKLGMEHLTAFERIAVVTDKDWIEHSVKAFGWVMPGEVRAFDESDQDDAVSWLASA